MVAKFGSALLSITVAMLVVGLFLSGLPVTAATDPCFPTTFAKEATWTEHEDPGTDSEEAVRQPLVTAMAAPQFSDETAARQFNVDFQTATEDLVSWGEEDADTRDCLLTLWRPFADPTNLGSMASQMVKVKELELRDSVDHRNCSDFKEMYHQAMRDTDFDRTNDAAGDTAEPGKPAAGDTTTPNKKAAGDAAASDKLRKDLQLQGKDGTSDEIVAHRKVGAPPDEELEYLVRWENCSNLQVTWEPTSSLLYASKKLKQYHKKEREIRVAAEATNGLGEAPSLAFIETDLAALMLSDPAKLGVKL